MGISQRHRPPPIAAREIPDSIQERTELPYAAPTADVLLVGVEALLRRAYAGSRMRGRRGRHSRGRDRVGANIPFQVTRKRRPVRL